METETITDDVMTIAAVIVKTAAEMIHDVNKIAAIPGVHLACSSVKSIIEMCQAASANKKEMKLLGQRCYLLLLILRADCAGKSDDYVNGVVNGACRTLREIKEQISQWREYHTLKSVIFSKSISGEIMKCHQKLDQATERIQVSAALQTIAWQKAADLARVEDTTEIVSKLDTILADQLQNQDEARTLIREVAEEVNDLKITTRPIIDFMGLIQHARRYITLRRPSNDPARHNELQQQLMYLKIESGELPPSTTIDNRQIRREPYAIAQTCWAQYDIYEGTWLGLRGERVALKVLHGVKRNEKEWERFKREVNIWRQVTSRH